MAENGTEDLGLTDKQSQLLEKFRDVVSDVRQPHHDDHYLLRWLKARAWDLPKAEDMLRKHLLWRNKYNIDNIAEYKAPEVLHRYFPGGPAGYCTEHCPIWITPSGGLDMRGLTLSAKRFDIIMYNMQKVEEMCRKLEVQSKKVGRYVDKVIIIDDFEGFTMKKLLQPGMDLLLKLLALIEANYPELLKACYIVNAPRWWSIIFNFCKPFLSEDTKNKMFVLGSDWREKILREVNADQLSEKWGGTASSEIKDNYIGEICMGGDVPTTYYLKERTVIDPDIGTTTTVAAGAKINLEFNVPEPNSMLKWIFKTEAHDIAFGVTYVIDVSTLSVPPSPTSSPKRGSMPRSKTKELMGEGNPQVAIVPVARVNCHQLPEDGYLECEQTGTYIIHFCNSHSWMTAKTLQYQIQVISPNATINETPSATTGLSESNDGMVEEQL